MELWPWAVDAYGRPDVASAALALQDQHGQCVPLLLWAAWARPVDSDLIGRAVSLARTWEAAAILPLRTARRGLKAALPGGDDAAREALRTQIKAGELEAERLLLGALARLGGSGGAALEVALTTTAAAWGGRVESLAVERLSRALQDVP